MKNTLKELLQQKKILVVYFNLLKSQGRRSPINLNNYSISTVVNEEFDCAYAFYQEDALDEEDGLGLGPVLSGYVRKDGNGVCFAHKIN